MKNLFKDKSEAAGYLAGVIDGEGYISPHPEVVIVNTDIELIKACAEACKMLGIDNYYINKGQAPSHYIHKQGYRFITSRNRSLTKLLKIPIRSNKKLDKLHEIVKKSNFSHRYNDEIATLKTFREKGLSLREISKKMNRHYITIWRWCKEYKIPKSQ